MFTKPNKFFLLYLGILSVIGGVVVYLATSRYGPGVSTDSAMILSTGDNLLKGHGLIDYRALPLTQFPPLYSIILAFGSLLIGQDVFVIGWMLSILVFSALIWFSGIYFFQAFADEPILAYFGSFIVFSSTSLIQISSNIASDPLFLLMVLFFLMIMSAYLKTDNLKYLSLAGVLTIASCFERYAGLSLVITGGLIAAYKHRSHIRDAIVWGSIFVIVTAIPIFLWGYLHNYLFNGTVFGARLPAVASLNFVTGVEKVLYWFVPYRIISSVGPLYLLGAILCILLVGIIAINAREFLQKLASAQVVPSLAFLFVYSGVLIFDISYYELKGIFTDRVHIIALPSLLLILLLAADHLVKAAKDKLGDRPIYGLAVALFVIWAVYPISKTAEYVRKSMQNGDVSSYNSINKGYLRVTPFAEYISHLDIHNNKVYSNGEDSAWLLLRTQINPIPAIYSEDRLAYLEQHYAQWPGPGNDGYVIWFNTEAHKEHLATPQELTTISSLNELYSDEYGSIYAVKSR